MRLISLFLGLVLAGLVCMPAQAAPVVPKDARVAVLGDSITEQRIYTQYLELYLVACQPQLRLRMMQYGWSGDTAQGMAGRVPSDLLPFKPTFVTTCYGMNDGGYRAFDANNSAFYETGMRSIVTQLKAAGATVLVGSPGAVDSKTFRNNPELAKVYNDTLAKFGEIDQKIAADNGMLYVSVHDPMVAAMAKAKAALGDDYHVCGGDGVHPAANGQLCMAYAFLKGMGFDGDLGTITVDLHGAATAVNGHKVLSAKDGVVEVESSRYPFCFPGNENPKDPNTASSILPYLPFNQELNRLTLVVTNLGPEQAKVTWGEESKVYSRAELEKGINLAADFRRNPFVPAFQKLQQAIAAKQEYETYLIKSVLPTETRLPAMLANDPAVTAAVDTIKTKLWEREETLMNNVLAGLAPVKHTITISTIVP